MLTGTFIAEIGDDKNHLKIPPEVVQSLNLQKGDKVEVMIKRIKSRRFDIKISKNPLYKILDLSGGKVTP